MKTTLFCRSTLLILSLLFFLPSSFAQDYTRWALPEGAKMRLGKGYIPYPYSPYLGRHSIGGMQYSPDGKLLAVASSIGVWLYDTETYRERALLTGHPSLVSSVCFSPDGRILASGSWDGTIKLWDVATGTLQRTLTSLGSVVMSVRFSPDRQTLASASAGEEWGYGIELWDVTTGSLRRFLSPEDPSEALSMDFSPDGQTLASGYTDDEMRLWDVATGDLQQTFSEHTERRYHVRFDSVRFSPDGQTLVSASQVVTRQGGHKIYKIRIWNVTSGEPVKMLTIGGVDAVSSVSWSADGQTLARGNLDGTIRLWDAARGEPVKMLIDHTDAVTNMCWSADGQTLASASRDGTIRLWDVATGAPRHTFTGHTSPVSRLYWRLHGQTLVSGYEDSKVRLWDVATGVPRHTFRGHPENGRSLSLSADGQMLASGRDDTTIRLWDVATGALLHTFPGHTLHVSNMCFSADGRILASWSWDSTIRLWDVATGTALKTLGTPIETLTASPDRVYGNRMDFSPDRQMLASGAGGVRLWDVATGTLLHTLTSQTGEILSVRFSPDGQTLASGDGFSDWTELGITEHTIRLWDVASGEPRKAITGHVGTVASLCWSPDGQTLASGGGYSGGEPPSPDYTVRVWDVATGKLQRTFTGHADEILSVRFSADGQTLASGSADGTVLLWDMAPEALPQKK